jgi:hypothetical protein
MGEMMTRSPTKATLNHRGIILNPLDLPCIFYFRSSEDCSHLFFHCSFSKSIWEEVFRWMGQNSLSGLDGSTHFVSFENMVKSKKCNRVSHLIWLEMPQCSMRSYLKHLRYLITLKLILGFGLVVIQVVNLSCLFLIDVLIL